MTRLLDYARLTRFDKPEGTLLLLWPALWGLWLAAEGWPGWKWLIVFSGGVCVMRAFGCAINDLADRRLDAQVTRTKNRPLAAGRISSGEAWAVAAFFLLLAFVLWWQLPWLARGWALAGLLLAALYPLAKRMMAAPQIVLGAAFSFSIPLAFVTLHNAPPPPVAWLFAAANWWWVLGYDTIYAMCDREDDVRAGTNSSAVWLGNNDVLAVSLFYVAAVAWLSVLGLWFLPGAVAYQISLVAAMGLVFRFWRLYRWRQPESCLLAFRINHWFGAFVWAGLMSAFV